MSPIEWTASEDFEILDVALEEEKTGKNEHENLVFWEVLAEKELLPCSRDPKECWERYKIIAEKHLKSRNGQNICTNHIHDKPETQAANVNEELDEITPIYVKKQRTKSTRNAPNSHPPLPVFEFSEYDCRDHPDSPKNQNNSHIHGDLEPKTYLASINCTQSGFLKSVQALFSVAELPGFCKALGTQRSRNHIKECAKEFYGSEKAEVLQTYITNKIFCTEAKAFMSKLKPKIRELDEDHLYNVLEEGSFFYNTGCDPKLASTILRVLVGAVKVAVFNESCDKPTLERIARLSKNRLQVWKHASLRNLLSNEMKSLKSFIIEKYEERHTFSMEELKIPLLFTSLEKTVQKMEINADMFLEKLISGHNIVREEVGCEMEANDLQSIKSKAKKELNLHFLSDDENGDVEDFKESLLVTQPCTELSGLKHSRGDGVPMGNVSDKVEIRVGYFAKSEDTLLRQGIEKYGFGNWKRIMNQLFVTNGFLRHPTSLKDRARVLGYVSSKKRKRKTTTSFLDTEDESV